MTGSSSLTTAADALRDEEIARMRLFILMGWGLSVLAIVTLYFVNAPRPIAIVFIAALVGGFLFSAFQYRAFADPKNYTERALIGLAIVTVINGHLGVFVFGVFSGAPVAVILGLHFVGRSELVRVTRWSTIGSAVAYTTLSVLII